MIDSTHVDIRTIEDLSSKALHILRTEPGAAKIYKWLQKNIREGELSTVLRNPWPYLGDEPLAYYIAELRYRDVEDAFNRFDSISFVIPKGTVNG